jgi:hypothetical protein
VPSTLLHKIVLIFVVGLFSSCLANLLNHVIPFHVGAGMLRLLAFLGDSLPLVGFAAVLYLYQRVRRTF